MTLRKEVRYRVCVVVQDVLLGRVGAEQAAVLQDDPSQDQHAQTYLDGVVLVAAREMLSDGTISRASAGVRVIRDNVMIYQGKLASLRRFKDDVREVPQGYECGLSIENFHDVKPGDIIEAYAIDKIAAKL